MARPLRIEFAGAVYHVTARGNERKNIFFSNTDYKKFLEYLKEAKKKFKVIVHSYVLMSNHYHLILETLDANLSKAMHYINGSYTTYINVKRRRSGHLFQGRYKSILVDKDNYLLELSRYIHLNPFRAKMVEKPEEYPYSSYSIFISNRKDNLVTRDLILELMRSSRGSERGAYKYFVDAAVGREIDNPAKDVYGGMILGGVGFIKETLRRIKAEYHVKDAIANRKALRATYGIEEVIEGISNYFNKLKSDVTTKEALRTRNIAVYLIKERTGATNRQIGEFFDGLTCSAVAKIYRKVTEEMRDDGKLRGMVRQIEKYLDTFKP